MYANVLNASINRGVSTSFAISGSSFWICSTIVPIGSSTSGIQSSSSPAMPRSLGRPAGGSEHSPRDVRGDDEHENGEQTPQDVLGQGVCDLDAALDADDRAEA